jgi:hypothetical protein
MRRAQPINTGKQLIAAQAVSIAEFEESLANFQAKLDALSARVLREIGIEIARVCCRTANRDGSPTIP